MSNLVWAFASLKWAHAPLLASIAAASIRHLPDFNAQALSNTAWSLAVLRDRHQRPLMEAIASESIARGAESVLGGRHAYAVLWSLWIASAGEMSLLWSGDRINNESGSLIVMCEVIRVSTTPGWKHSPGIRPDSTHARAAELIQTDLQ
eukprot:CAMPEP_0204528758 /NCGR_PEP_ID=MMETSP0661-20131031/9701_1 /ASSEMBLY_ACC=CAM_ASM_000606 /TAXON_ID=109239 /ORGANISM="Alexandrium margalefi, Strain AMGDE01CS-322" /LENGTH=148 /DNA_ID=CAMNT_0051534753 /DNA_START=40 /DNA_END=484 /DNA_ORIENTATION=+